jgi:hypothetical protein
MTFESATKIDYNKILRIVGEDSILVGYRNSDTHSSGLSMAQLAETLSFDHITPQGAFVPARPHLKEGLEYNESNIREAVSAYFSRLVNEGAKEGDKVGQVCLDGVISYLEEGVLKGIAPNAPSTIAKKGHDFPDIDTDELYKHLVYIYIQSLPAIGYTGTT